MLRGDQLTDSPQDVVSAVDVNFVCMRYMGSIEGTPQKRRLWFHSEQDLLTFRQLIRSTLQVRGANTVSLILDDHGCL